jgi:hypothetical protein
MNFPPLGKPDFGPLQRACDSALKSISNSLQGNLPSEASEILNNLASAIRSQREEVLAVFAKEYETLEAEYKELTSGINRLLEDEFPRLQTQLTAIPSLIEAEEKKAAAEAAAKHAAIPQPVEPKPMAFHPGEELIKNLMGLADQQDTRHQRTSGNIWENWQKPGS